MSQELTLGYVAGNSVIHRLDPLTKMIGLVGVIVFAIGAPVDYNIVMLGPAGNSQPADQAMPP